MDVDLSAWRPGAAREVILNIEVRHASGSADSGHIRSYSGQTTGLFCGSASPNFQSFSYQTIRTTSDRKVQYQITGGARAYIYVIGYNMSDPS